VRSCWTLRVELYFDKTAQSPRTIRQLQTPVSWVIYKITKRKEVAQLLINIDCDTTNNRKATRLEYLMSSITLYTKTSLYFGKSFNF
jgi:hypothetical protein